MTQNTQKLDHHAPKVSDPPPGYEKQDWQSKAEAINALVAAVVAEAPSTKSRGGTKPRPSRALSYILTYKSHK